MNGRLGVPNSSALTFFDPDQYQAAIRGGDNLYNLLGRGIFRADLTNIELNRLSLQRGRETLPRLAASGMSPDRVGIVVWFGNSQLPIVRGVQIRRGELLCLGRGMQSHHRTFGSNDFVAMTLDASDLSSAAIELTGQELAVTAGKIVRPPAHLLAWLLSVIDTATRLTQTTPDIFMSPLAAEALEHALLQPMIMCLLHGEAREEAVPHGRRATIAKRFEAAVEANFDRPLLIPELCRIIGVSDRVLRALCQEQLRMSPQRFLALRRLHLARRALLRSDHHSTTVAEVATGHGVWELGRFAVAYKSVFGESPSATLRRPPTM